MKLSIKEANLISKLWIFIDFFFLILEKPRYGKENQARYVHNSDVCPGGQCHNRYNFLF